MVGITPFELAPAALCDWVVTPTCGAVLCFSGTVRDSSREAIDVVRIVYEAYEPYAQRVLEELCDRMLELWPQVGRVAALHRVGPVALSEASVVLAVSSPHRAESFEALAFGIDVLKVSLPVWKKEHGRGDPAWVHDGARIRSIDEATDDWIAGALPRRS
jgi:molybdopterin synthase catalytic subunit